MSEKQSTNHLHTSNFKVKSKLAINFKVKDANLLDEGWLLMNEYPSKLISTYPSFLLFKLLPNFLAVDLQ